MALELHWRWHTLYAAIWSWTVKGCANCLYEQLDKLNKVPQVSTRPRFPLLSKVANRPRSIYQYSNMVPRLSGQTSIFGVVFFVSKSLLGIERQKKLKKFTILTRQPRSHVRILMYRTWPIQHGYQARIFNEDRTKKVESRVLFRCFELSAGQSPSASFSEYSNQNPQGISFRSSTSLLRLKVAEHSFWYLCSFTFFSKTLDPSVAKTGSKQVNNTNFGFLMVRLTSVPLP